MPKKKWKKLKSGFERIRRFKDRRIEGSKTEVRRLNWSGFTNFGSRCTRYDLAKLCSGLDRQSLIEVFETPDKGGLYPIHWASIHNRSDLIEFMVDNGSPLRIKCLNKLLANGTALHLAAMNGCIEAAAVLINKWRQLINSPNQTKPKSLMTDAPSDTKIAVFDNWLAERDLEGQTALMRSAAPRSKRINIIKDLLRKNFWSLSGRPSEMALYLISRGANWRDKDLLYGMNLLHLSIVNNYDDIAHMLLVIDPELVEVPARPPLRPPTESEDKLISIKSNASSSDTSHGSDIDEPLINKDREAKSLVESGLSPVQLAILYGRLSVIEPLWRPIQTRFVSSKNVNKLESESHRIGQSREKKEELKNLKWRVFWSSKEELMNFSRRFILKFILGMDWIILALVWMPIYLGKHDKSLVSSLRDGAFIVSFSLTVAFAFRVAFKNPGYLHRSTTQYQFELSSILNKREPGDNVQKVSGPSNFESTRLARESSERPNELRTNAMLEKPDLETRVRLLCHFCQCIRKPRSRHCRQCNRCIMDFDHHCIYLNCCIGRRNRLDFLIMLILVSLTGIYGSIIMASSLSHEQWRSIQHCIGFVWICKYVIIGCISLFLNLRRACLGVTMYEAMRSNRIIKLFGRSGTPSETSESHKEFSIEKGSFWRYTPNRFLRGDLSLRTIMENLEEFATMRTNSWRGHQL